MNAIEMSLIKWAWKRMMSESPEFAKRVRAIAGVTASLLYALTWLIEQHYLQLPTNYTTMVYEISHTFGIACTGVFGATWLSTTDPQLMSPSSVRAIQQAAKTQVNKIVIDPAPIGPQPEDVKN
jgi:hypothetical protein